MPALRFYLSLLFVGITLSACDRCSETDCKPALEMRSLSDRQLKEKSSTISTEQLWKMHLWEMTHSRPPSSRIGTVLVLRKDVGDVVSKDYQTLELGFEQEVAIELLVAAAQNGNQLQITNKKEIKDRCSEMYSSRKEDCEILISKRGM